MVSSTLYDILHKDKNLNRLITFLLDPKINDFDKKVIKYFLIHTIKHFPEYGKQIKEKFEQYEIKGIKFKSKNKIVC